jgi:hypothetical protein
MTAIDVALATESHARLLAALAPLTDDGARRRSRLPGWTVGHVLTHLARNADSHLRMLEAARRGEIHHVDLGLGYGATDWPDAYVDVELARSLAGLPLRLAAGEAVDIRATDTGERWLVPAGVETGRTVAGARRDLLAWLVGRGGDAGFPIVGPWAG